MHPNPAFRLDDRAAMTAFIARTGFAHLFAMTPTGAAVAHAPLTPAGDRLRFHLARANRLTPHLDGSTVLASVAGPQGYVSPSWYTRGGDQVPTWNYVAVEIEGVARRLDEAALVEQLDTLASLHEPRVAPDRPWSRAKLGEEALGKLLRSIVGFEIEITAMRGTAKLSQNKTPADRDGVIRGLRDGGDTALADAMRA